MKKPPLKRMNPLDGSTGLYNIQRNMHNLVTAQQKTKEWSRGTYLFPASSSSVTLEDVAAHKMLQDLIGALDRELYYYHYTCWRCKGEVLSRTALDRFLCDSCRINPHPIKRTCRVCKIQYLGQTKNNKRCETCRKERNKQKAYEYRWKHRKLSTLTSEI